MSEDCQKRCLFCCQSIPQRDNGGYVSCTSFKTCFPGSNSSKTLNEILTVYFITRKLLKFSDEKCLRTVEALSVIATAGNGHESSSLRMCKCCHDIVGNAFECHQEILRLQDKINVLGNRLSRVISESGNDKESFVRGRSRNDDDGDYLVYQELRSLICSDPSKSLEGSIVKVEAETCHRKFDVHDDDADASDDFFFASELNAHDDEEIETKLSSSDEIEWTPRPKFSRGGRKRGTEKEPEDKHDKDYTPTKKKRKLRKENTSWKINFKNQKKLFYADKYKNIVISKQDSNFHCPFCSSVILTPDGYRTHIRRHQTSDLNGNLYDCKICGFPTISVRSLHRHMNLKHENDDDEVSLREKVALNVKNDVDIVSGSNSNDDKEKGRDMLEGFPRSASDVDAENDEAETEKTSQVIAGWSKREESDKDDVNYSPTKLADLTQKKKVLYAEKYANIVISKNKSRYPCKFCSTVVLSAPGYWRHLKMHQASDLMGNTFDCKTCGYPTTSAHNLKLHLSKVNDHENDDGETSFESANVDSSGSNSTKAFQEVQCKSESDDNVNSATPPKKRKRRSLTPAKPLSGRYRYVCGKCKAVYRNTLGLRKHKKEHEASVALNHKFDCECGFPASCERNLYMHKKRIHGEVPWMKCSECSYGTFKRFRLKEHMRTHSRVKGPRKPDPRAKLTGTINGRNAEGLFECTQCPVTYKAVTSLEKHLQEHAKSKEEGSKFECDVCKFPSRDEARLRFHKAQVHEKQDDSLDCKICRRTFARMYKLRDHLVCHERYDKFLDSTTGLYKCPVCPPERRHMSLKAFIVHKNSSHYTDSRLTDPTVADKFPSFLCTECGLRFTTKYGLRAHVRCRHENPDGFACDVCGKSLLTKQSLKIHMKSHEKNRTKEYVCTCCGAQYSYRHTLALHMAKYHPDQEDLYSSAIMARPQKPGAHKCKWCNEVFPFKYLLVNHMPIAHKDMYTFQCDMCSKAYTSASSLKLHKEVLHSDGSRQFACEGCGKVFIHKHYAFTHYKYCPGKKQKNKSSADHDQPTTSMAMDTDEMKMNESTMTPTTTNEIKQQIPFER